MEQIAFCAHLYDIAENNTTEASTMPYDWGEPAVSYR